MTKSNKINIALGFLLITVTVVLFLFSLQIRRDWYGVLARGGHQWLSGSTIKFARYWYREGAWQTKFASVEFPKSIDKPNLSDREIYVSYPPGTMIPIWLIGKIGGVEPNAGLVMSYNLINHFLVALLLSLSVFVLLAKIGLHRAIAAAYALIPIPLELFLPGPLYYHQNVFYADQAVILPFALMIFLETLRTGNTNAKSIRLINISQAILLFWGTFIDWFFLPIAFVFYIKRVLESKDKAAFAGCVKKTLLFWLPVILSVGIFIGQVCLLKALPMLKAKFLYRTALDERGASEAGGLNLHFWHEHLPLHLGKPAVTIVWAGLFLFLAVFLVYLIRRFWFKREAREEIKQPLMFMGLVTTACFLQIYLLRSHSTIHDFAALKFSIVMAVVPFVLVPVLFAAILKRDLQPAKFRRYEVFFCVLALLGSLAYVQHYWSVKTRIFPEPDYQMREIGEFVERNTGYEDVVFSNFYEIPGNPPQALSYSMKQVRLFSTISDINGLVDNISGEYIINILAREGYRSLEVERLERVAFDKKEQSDFYLYKIKKSDFLNLLTPSGL